MTGQVRFCVDVARHGGAGVGEDAGDGLVGRVADLFVLVDDDACEEGRVEHAAFSWLGLGVEVPEIGEDVRDLIEPGARGRVGVGEAVEPVGDRVEAGADAFLFAL
ncbi:MULTISPECIES: hypothetical protein [Micrococcus]|uniref:hypothetical protein n=1 Tax=Micrococcus TaxID=1269 RepID=UPI00069760D2|nr:MULTISPECIES: hypothetical protein [Micrococcus]MBU8649522.1 hypothetical protein [Micrococcus luteus]MCT1858188.1 hypothetical protein [Micrococcus luteus]MCV7514769.1 hypothetical protein [Micrococcus luteus]MCV7728573.1 hypothetical protein [Micrococcus luteus]MDK7328171.1 hypothetical protein [Micrococcus luteus]